VSAELFSTIKKAKLGKSPIADPYTIDLFVNSRRDKWLLSSGFVFSDFMTNGSVTGQTCLKDKV